LSGLRALNKFFLHSSSVLFALCALTLLAGCKSWLKTWKSNWTW